jgi:hypothetical protein
MLDGNLGHLKPVKHRTPGMQIAVGLRRMFSWLAGMPLSEYVRRRRMTVAAAEVVTGIGDLLYSRATNDAETVQGTWHHRIFDIGIARRHTQLLTLAGWIPPDLEDWISSRSRVDALVARRPC